MSTKGHWKKIGLWTLRNKLAETWLFHQHIKDFRLRWDEQDSPNEIIIQWNSHWLCSENWMAAILLGATSNILHCLHDNALMLCVSSVQKPTEANLYDVHCEILWMHIVKTWDKYVVMTSNQGWLGVLIHKQIKTINYNKYQWPLITDKT